MSPNYYNRSKAGKTFNASGLKFDRERGYKRPNHSKKMSGPNNPMYSKKGDNHPKYGIGLTEEQRKRCSEGCLNWKKAPCKYCGKVCSPSTLSRWHNENCKQNPDYQEKVLTCPHCHKTGKSSGMKRWHFINCGASS